MDKEEYNVNQSNPGFCQENLTSFTIMKTLPFEETDTRTKEELKRCLKEPFKGWRPIYAIHKMGL